MSTIIVNKQPAKTKTTLQTPRSLLETKVQTMLDIFDAELALVSERAHYRHVTAAARTAKHYAVKDEAMTTIKTLFLQLRLFRTPGGLAPRSEWGQVLGAAERFFAANELRST